MVDLSVRSISLAFLDERPLSDSTPEITRLLHEAYGGRDGALDEVMALVYQDLLRIADGQMRRRYGQGSANLTMEPRALVSEAFMRLIKQRKKYDSRGHFFAIATRTMLRVLMDYDRKRKSEKRGADQVKVSLSGIPTRAGEPEAIGISELASALKRLQALDARTAEVLQLRLLWGLSVAEVARTLDLSVRTVEREWRFGRRWMAVQLGGPDDAS
jgi:RNA polymerase sigma factor (TIGR02999 family)